MNRSINFDHLTLGVCYYPEHWDKSLWKDDLYRMKEYGIEVIRIAEFAWNKFEPHEGEFTFDFYDEFMDLTLAEGIKVIFCTPTATPPAWMSHNYPEILNADADGHLIHHGLRRHYNMNSPKYREFTARIVEKLAEHYSKYPNIIMWQLDNEINCECDRYYSESDHKAFREYVKNHFGTLENYNKEIGADFWNQTYTDWKEVHLPRRTNFGATGNPHVDLLEKHFISDTVIGYFKLQADIVRKYTNVPITTNGIFGHIDYHKLVGDVLDFITYDNYPNFAFEKNQDITSQNGLRDRNTSYNLSTIRSISPTFGIMEQQSGPSGWNFRMVHATPKPGRLRLWTLQAIAHGADFVSFFRWRTCTFGTEIYWHGLHDYDNRPNRRTAELCETHKDIQKLQPLCGKEYFAEAAILKDYDNMWDGEEDLWHSEVDRISNDGWFRAFQKKHVPFDFKYVTEDTTLDELKKYKLLVYPHPTIFTEKRAALLKAYAEQGGTVIFGCRTGYKKLNGSCYMMPMPGYAAELVGAEVEEFTFLSPYDEAQFVTIGDIKISAPCFNDVLTMTDGEAIGTFDSNYYAGKPAVSVKKLGKGKAYYFGGAFGEDTAKYFIDKEGLTAPLGIDSLIDLPENIELAVRGEHIILLNYGEEAVTMKCSGKFKELISNTVIENQIVINGIDAIVLTQL
ncbi:MAG: beta-galactosidase [Lachnospiraceae bacterium]|nr:beta-galactosidase [Lachnospiraceae bacterium]